MATPKTYLTPHGFQSIATAPFCCPPEKRAPQGHVNPHPRAEDLRAQKVNQSVKGLKCMVGSSTQLSHTDLVPSPGLRPFQCATETALLPADAFLSSALARVLP